METTFETFKDLKKATLKIGYTKVVRLSNVYVEISDGDSVVPYVRRLNGTWQRGA